MTDNETLIAFLRAEVEAANERAEAAEAVVTQYRETVASMGEQSRLRLEGTLAGAGRLWLWRNGPHEFWAFDNPYPCESPGGDPLTLGEPVGIAIVKPSVNGRPDRTDDYALERMRRFRAEKRGTKP